ncbi:MAG: hypothetical protein M0R03_14690 [Novosphingobium sp.]|nr:hypothetical protein [Novosphingobium sp.]
MTDRNPHRPDETHDLAHQKDESKGVIKRPQQTDATMAEKDLPRGSEKETHARK